MNCSLGDTPSDMSSASLHSAAFLLPIMHNWYLSTQDYVYTGET